MKEQTQTQVDTASSLPPSLRQPWKFGTTNANNDYCIYFPVTWKRYYLPGYSVSYTALYKSPFTYLLNQIVLLQKSDKGTRMFREFTTSVYVLGWFGAAFERSASPSCCSPLLSCLLGTRRTLSRPATRGRSAVIHQNSPASAVDESELF